MLSVQDFMNIKEKLGYKKIIYIKFGRYEFVFKLINPTIYIKARIMTSTDEEFNDIICQSALIYPKEFIFSKSPIAGIADNISKQIIHKSHILDEKSVIDCFEKSRNKLGTFLEQSSLFVKAAFPEFPIKEIQSWDYEKLMDMTAKSEYILKLRGVDVELEYDKKYLKSLVDIDTKNSDEKNKKIESQNTFLNSKKIASVNWNNLDNLKVLQKEKFKNLVLIDDCTVLNFIKLDSHQQKNKANTNLENPIGVDEYNLYSNRSNLSHNEESKENFNDNLAKIHSKMLAILNDAGYKNIDINCILGGKDSNIDLNFYENRSEKFKIKMLKMIGDIINE